MAKEKKKLLIKTCSVGHPCEYRCLGGTVGWGCKYTGYCDFQLPRDSRKIKNKRGIE